MASTSTHAGAPFVARGGIDSNSLSQSSKNRVVTDDAQVIPQSAYHDRYEHWLPPKGAEYQSCPQQANRDRTILRLLTIADGIMIGSALLLLPLKDDQRTEPSMYYMVFTLWLISTMISVMAHGLRSGHPKLHVLATLAALLVLCLVMVQNPGGSLEGLIPFFPLLTTCGGLFVAFIASHFPRIRNRRYEYPRYHGSSEPAA